MIDSDHSRILREMTTVIKAGLYEKEDLERILSLVIEGIHAERGAIFFLENDHLRLLAGLSKDRNMIRDAKKFSRTLVKLVMEDGNPIMSKDARKDSRLKDSKSVLLNQIRSAICVPLKTENRIIGTIYADSCIAKIIFQDMDVYFLLLIAGPLADAIEWFRISENLRGGNLPREEILMGAISFVKGKSKTIQNIYKVIKKVAPTDCTLLLIGETGVGKNYMAQFIHNQSKRKNQKFITVNCGALPETLFESELFGYCKGAFTGAIKSKPGLFEEAEKGTIFFNEIANTSLALQAKLLEVMEYKALRRLEETKSKKIDVRIICATNQDLKALVIEKKFREDLYHRLNALPINIPPLRERKVDIPIFAFYFVKEYAKEFKKPFMKLTSEVLKALQNYPWSGNIRELKNVMERAVLLGSGPEIRIDDIDPNIVQYRDSIKEGKREHQKEEIIKALRITEGDIEKAAKKLYITPRHLYRLLKKYNIKRRDYSK